MRLKVWSTAYNSEEKMEKGQYVENGGEAMINVLIEKENSAPNRVKCQKHTKIKDVTWWVLVGDSQNNLLQPHLAPLHSNSNSHEHDKEKDSHCNKLNSFVASQLPVLSGSPSGGY